MDQILIRRLLDDAQGKLAQISGLQGESLSTPSSFFWRQALDVHPDCDRLRIAHEMLEKPGLHLDSVTKTFKENHCGMDLVVQKHSDIRKKGNKVAHPEDVPKKKYLEVIGRHRNSKERAGLEVIVEFLNVER
jgi:hypothetical protein